MPGMADSEGEGRAYAAAHVAAYPVEYIAGIDLYNALNSSAVLTYNLGFVPGGTWLQPITFVTGRLIKFSAEITF